MVSCPDPAEFFWQDSPGRTEILAHSRYFKPTTQLDTLVNASTMHRVVVLTGEAGAGKSCLATALARPEIAGGRVPDGFVHALSILTSDTNPASLGLILRPAPWLGAGIRRGRCRVRSERPASRTRESGSSGA